MASAPLMTSTAAADAAKLARWERLAQPFIILAAIAPLLGTVAATLASAFHLADTRPTSSRPTDDPAAADPNTTELTALRAELADLSALVRRALGPPNDRSDPKR